MREVRFYRTKSGDCPVEKFLDALNGKQAQKVVWVLRLVEQLAPVPAQYFKKLVDTDGLWEARAQHVPRQELEIAEARRQDHLSRRNKHE